MKKNIILTGLLLISSIIQSASNYSTPDSLEEMRNRANLDVMLLNARAHANCNKDLLHLCGQKENNENICSIVWYLEHGANVNYCNEDNATPLIKAAAANNERIMRILINMGADINQTTKYGHTPLTLTAINNNHKLVDLLLSHGAQVNTDKPRYNPIVRTTDPVIKAMIIEHQASAFYKAYLALMWQEFEALQNQLRTELAATSSTP